MNATLRLFKAVPVLDRTDTRRFYVDTAKRLDSFEIYRKTLPKGFVLAPEVLEGYVDDLDTLIKTVDAECGLDPNRLNKAFHKSFDKVRSASMEQLYLEQMAHYLTTYGRQMFGVYDADRIYIPAERLDAPKIDVETFDFVVIRGWTITQIKTALMDLLSTGVALSDQSVKDALEVAEMVGVSVADIEQVRNREVKIGLYDLKGAVPTDPVEFLRYVVYKTTGETLLIKNNKAVAALRDGVVHVDLFKVFFMYDEAVGLSRLGEIFLRYKPLFLALRADKRLRPIINRIRRAAVSNHKPLPENYLNNVTGLIKNGSPYEAGTKNSLSYARLQLELQNPNVNIFRKIRLAQALATRANPDLDSIVYRVRNGKTYATEFTSLTPHAVSESARAYGAVMTIIGMSLMPDLMGKKVYVPKGVVYGLPSTEKQFTGNLPAGTYVEVPRNEALVAGIYWEDQGSYATDLDLSVSNIGGKIGWDGRYRSRDNGVLFSGDNTSAPNGASEVFWFDPSVSGSWLMNVNYYNYYHGTSVPFKIVIGTADASDIKSNFVFDPNRLLASATATVNSENPQMNLGVVVANQDGPHRFYVTSSTAGGGATSRYSAHAEHARKFMAASMLHAPTLNDLLSYTGAIMVDSADQADEGFNLSPQAVDKTTILSLLTPGK